MARLLHIDSSALSNGSVSKEIASTFLAAWRQAHPDGTVVHRDLGLDPVPPLAEIDITASLTAPEAQTSEQAAAFAARVELAQEVLDADTYLLTAPMYNWGIPSTFKAWLDQIILRGYTANFGGEPPLGGRPATLILSYGGGYDPGTPREGWDFVQPYLETVLGKALALDLTIIKTQLTLAERNPAMADLILHAKEQRSAAHTQAEAHARTIGARLAAV
jgi:FMN-dependent NADH-azoreductase